MSPWVYTSTKSNCVVCNLLKLAVLFNNLMVSHCTTYVIPMKLSLKGKMVLDAEIPFRLLRHVTGHYSGAYHDCMYTNHTCCAT
jgi:hypothetical protein